MLSGSRLALEYAPLNVCHLVFGKRTFLCDSVGSVNHFFPNILKTICPKFEVVLIGRIASTADNCNHAFKKLLVEIIKCLLTFGF